jgi:hypothetical protein
MIAKPGFLNKLCIQPSCRFFQVLKFSNYYYVKFKKFGYSRNTFKSRVASG